MAKWCSIQGTKVPVASYLLLDGRGFFPFVCYQKICRENAMSKNTLNVKFMRSLSYNLLNMQTNLCDSIFMGKQS